MQAREKKRTVKPSLRMGRISRKIAPVKCANVVNTVEINRDGIGSEEMIL